MPLHPNARLLFFFMLYSLTLSCAVSQERKMPKMNFDSLRVLDSLAILDSLITIDSVSIDATSAKVDSIYPFIRYSENKLQFYGSDFEQSGFARLFGAMAELKQGKKKKVTILHVGGSHIQADVWSGETRRLLREWSGREGERGFIFPQKLARSNGSPNFLVSYTGWWSYHKNILPKVSYPIGLAGVATATHDSLAHLTLTLVGETHAEFPYPQYHFTRAKIFHNADSSCFELALDTAIAHQKTTSQGWGYTEFVFEKPQTRLPLRVYKSSHRQVQFVLFGISLENDEGGFNYTSVGINGATVNAFLHCSLLELHLKTLKPDLVVFSLGVNDSRYEPFNVGAYEKNYDNLVRLVKSASPNTAILFTTNSDNFKRRWHQNRNTAIARDALIRLAKRHNAAVWDLFNVMGGLGSFKQWHNAKLAKKDRVHFNRQGYRLIGKLMFDALIDGYDTRLNTRTAKQ
jgi:lysophospholipase L1-like esterase